MLRLSRVLLLIAAFLVVRASALGQSEQFRFLKLDVKNGLSNNHPTCFLLDSRGFMWIGTNSGLNRYDGSTLKIFKNDPRPPAELTRRGINPALVRAIHQDKGGRYWFAQDNLGLYVYFQRNGGKTVRLQHSSRDPSTIADNQIAAIAHGPDGNIWIIHKNGTLEKIEPETLKVTWRSDDDDKNAISQNTFNAIYKDSTGVIWLGTYKGGVNYYHEDIFRFPLFKHKRAAPTSLPYNDINRFLEDDQGNIWMGSNGGGLIYYDRKKKTYKQFLHDASNPNSVSSNVIISLYHNPSDPGSLSHHSVW